jgi:hypothetical protein
MSFIIVSKMILVIVLYLFLPLTALTYYVFRRRRRRFEVERIFARLPIDSAYQKVYDDETVSWYFLSAVGYASVVGSLGLMLVFLGQEIGLDEFPSLKFGTNTATATATDTATKIPGFPQQGSRLVVGMALLGAYL